jgi:large subunit ribosomal protein L22
MEGEIVAKAATQGGRWRAMHRFARISPRKARLVMDLIRGLHVNDAQDTLRFTPKKGSRMIDKVLRSAIANANEQEADVRALYVAEARVDPAPHMRRWRPKDRGRAHPIAKRMSHLVVALEER